MLTSTDSIQSPARLVDDTCVCAGGSIEQLSMTCEGAYSRVLGLLRLGGHRGREAAGLKRMDFVGMANV